MLPNVGLMVVATWMALANPLRATQQGFPVLVPVAAEDIGVTAPEGHLCLYGCVVGANGWVYEITRQDVTWIAKVSKAESGPRFVPAEASATIWALLQNFYRVSQHRPSQMSLATFIQNYSAACSPRWATGGSKGYHPRITPRADHYRAMKWYDIPARWRRFAVEVICADVPNRSPGLVHVLARGFEDSAASDLIGPWYATTKEQHPGGNAYYWTPETAEWDAEEVKISPATLDMTCLFVS